MMNEHRVDAVFEGGGVKGIGLAGAVAVTEQEGYEFENVAGTSAGAIVAALVAAGYRAAQLKEILEELDYKALMDRGKLGRLPAVGPLLSLLVEKGIFEGRYFEDWLRGLLRKAPRGPVESFGDLVMADYARDPRYRYRLRVVAADLSLGKLLVLPQDIESYGRSTDELNVAWAVRMSMSIPFFYKPVRLQGPGGALSFVVDGGILSNFPVWLFDDGSHDALYIKDADFARTVPIPTLGVRTTDFGLSGAQRDGLYRSGEGAARDFFKSWSFDRWKASYRRESPPHRWERT